MVSTTAYGKECTLRSYIYIYTLYNLYLLQEKKEKAEKEDEPQEMRRWQFSFRPVEVMVDGWLIRLCFGRKFHEIPRSRGSWRTPQKKLEEI